MATARAASVVEQSNTGTKEYLLPVRFDDTPVPGLPDSVHYLRAEEYSSVALATVIAQKLGVKPFEGKASDVPPLA